MVFRAGCSVSHPPALSLTTASLPPLGTGAIPAPVPTGGSSGQRRVVSTNGQRSRRVEPEEVEFSDEWEQTVSCDPSSAGQRTNSTQAKMEMEISTDVAGITIASQSSSSEGELKLSLGGVEVAKEQVEQMQPPAGQEGTTTGCEVTFKWSREASLGDLSQKLEISWTWPILQKRQEAPWGQIDQIVVFGDKEALKQVTLGKSYTPGSDGAGGSGSSGGSSASSPSSGASSGAAAPAETSASTSGSNTSVPEKQSAVPMPGGLSSGALGTWTTDWGMLFALVLGAVVA